MLIGWLLLACSAPEPEVRPGTDPAETSGSGLSTAPETSEPCVSEPVALDWDDPVLGFSAAEVQARFEGTYRAQAFDEAGEPVGEVTANVLFGPEAWLWSYVAVEEGATCPAERWVELPVEVRLKAEDGSFAATYVSRWIGETLGPVLQAGEYLDPGAVDTTLDLGGAREVWVQVVVDQGGDSPVLSGEVQAIIAPEGEMVQERTLLSW